MIFLHYLRKLRDNCKVFSDWKRNTHFGRVSQTLSSLFLAICGRLMISKSNIHRNQIVCLSVNSYLRHVSNFDGTFFVVLYYIFFSNRVSFKFYLRILRLSNCRCVNHFHYNFIRYKFLIALLKPDKFWTRSSAFFDSFQFRLPITRKGLFRQRPIFFSCSALSSFFGLQHEKTSVNSWSVLFDLLKFLLQKESFNLNFTRE